MSSAPSAPSTVVVVTRLASGVGHPARDGQFCCHRDDLRQTLRYHPLPGHGSSIPSPHDVHRQLIDESAALCPEAPVMFDGECSCFWLRLSRNTRLG